MSDHVVRMDNVGKMYKIFPSRTANLLDALGFRAKKTAYREFWALRGLDLELRRGARVGIIGRNGAGKTTILKLITQNVEPTEGRLEVKGQVQALLETGGGLHPEFTGSANIHASLAFLGLGPKEIAEAEREIAEFTELGRFLGQPFKTYSLGMQARLAFGIATTVQPEILIIDEVLGAGDAYFLAKSTARMRALIDSGASVLLVSHALDQVVRFCDETIWLDRGRVVMRGPSTEVVKAYEKFIRELEDKRLQAKNRKTLERFDAFERESYTDQVNVELRADGGQVDVADVRLIRDGRIEDQVEVGGPQDGDSSQPAFVVLDGGAWSSPGQDNGVFFRPVREGAAAVATFYLWFFYPDSQYEVELRYRATTGGAALGAGRRGKTERFLTLPAAPAWRTERLALAGGRSRVSGNGSRASAPEVSRWPGEGSLLIEDVRLLAQSGLEQTVFEAGSAMTMVLRIRARSAGRYEVLPAATIYRADGILVSNHPGEQITIELEEGGSRELTLEFGPLNFGNGRYIFSVALYRRLAHLDASEAYDLLDRSYEFEVVGNEPFNNGVFRHPSHWALRG
jgi:lipopolysaccharide transport system ATP-binding protein